MRKNETSHNKHYVKLEFLSDAGVYAAFCAGFFAVLCAFYAAFFYAFRR